MRVSACASVFYARVYVFVVHVWRVHVRVHECVQVRACVSERQVIACALPYTCTPPTHIRAYVVCRVELCNPQGTLLRTFNYSSCRGAPHEVRNISGSVCMR